MVQGHEQKYHIFAPTLSFVIGIAVVCDYLVSLRLDDRFVDSIITQQMRALKLEIARNEIHFNFAVGIDRSASAIYFVAE